MTISSQVRTAGPFACNGSTTVFPFAFKVFTASDVSVVFRDTASGAEVPLVLNIDYTVSLNANQNANPGGAISTIGLAFATGTTLTLTSKLQYLQPTDLTNQGAFYPKVISDALDRLTIFVQQVLGIANRALKFPISDGNLDGTLPGKDQRKGRVLVFHETTGLPIAGPSIGDVIPNDYIGEDLPVNPFNGMRWYKPSEATTFVYYVDGDSGQWVQEPVVSADSTLELQLAAADSTVLIAGVEASEIATNYNQADALLFPNGAFWDSPVLSERTMVDIKNFQGQDGTYPAKEPVIVHDYSDGRRTMQLDKVGGSAADYVLGLRRANNPTNRPDKAADYVAPVGYLECSYDSFDGVGGAKLVNKSFYLDPNANLVWTGKNGSAVTSAQFITLKPDGDGRYPFWFTATQEADLFMRFTNPSGDLLQIRDDVGGTRTRLLVDSNQSSGLRIECLAGPLDLVAGTNITVRSPINTAASTDLTLTPSRDLLLSPVSGSTKCDTPFRLRSYSVSSAPSATTFDQHLIYVTNGDAGQPCLAVAQGGVWKRISLGAAISST